MFHVVRIGDCWLLIVDGSRQVVKAASALGQRSAIADTQPVTSM
jgi:hypothetical protein